VCVFVFVCKDGEMKLEIATDFVRKYERITHNSSVPTELARLVLTLLCFFVYNLGLCKHLLETSAPFFPTVLQKAYVVSKCELDG
jgi:hypothetical protein